MFDCEIKTQTKSDEDDGNQLLDSFITAKRIEGCSEKTLKYYRTTIENMTEAVGKSVRHIQTEDLRTYLTNYQRKNSPSRVTIDNIRRIFFFVLCLARRRDYIVKSPVRRIHKVKTGTQVKEVLSDENIDNSVIVALKSVPCHY